MAGSHSVGNFRVPDNIYRAVQDAARTTGVDFDYMLAQAAQESGFDADARARTSSATGLYQFIDSTWLDVVERHGAKHGLGHYARLIERDVNGRLSVADAGHRREILNLRNDPGLNALMAGEFARDNADHLYRTVGGHIGAPELYLAHFLGPQGASNFISAYRENPQGSAAVQFPSAARANRAVFYDGDTGREKTLAEVYDWSKRKMGRAAADGGVAAAPRDAVNATNVRDQFLSASSGVRSGFVVGAATPPPPITDQPFYGETTEMVTRAHSRGANALSLWATLTAQSVISPDNTGPGQPSTDFGAQNGAKGRDSTGLDSVDQL